MILALCDKVREARNELFHVLVRDLSILLVDSHDDDSFLRNYP